MSKNSSGCRQTPRAARKVIILIPDYPAAAGRTGYAVGLDVPASVLAMLQDLKAEGYAVGDIPETPRALLDRLEQERCGAEPGRIQLLREVAAGQGDAGG